MEDQKSSGILEFDKEDVTLLLALGGEKQTPAYVRAFAEQKGFLPKTEFHIMLVGTATGRDIFKRLNDKSTGEKKDILQKIEDLSRTFAWSFTPQEEYYAISRSLPATEGGAAEKRQSIIQAVILPDLALFYEKLNQLLGTNFEVPPSHITLFATSTREDKKLRGIGTYSKEHFHSLNPMKLEPPRV